MPKYRVTINGRNYLINSEGRPQRMGFYKIYYLEAQDPQEAENLAVSQIVGDPRWRGTLLNSADDRPVMYLHALAELESFEGVESTETGYVFYPDEEAGR
jgi:hypothetical protein